MTALRWLLLAMVPACFGCVSQKGWQTDAEIVPSTYQVGALAIDRSVGKLRRLVLIPARFQYTGSGPFLEAIDRLGRNEEMTADTLASVFLARFSEAATDILVVNKGYELAAWQTDGSGDPSGPKPTEIARLAEWAHDSPDGAATPDDVANIARSLGRLANADGILVIQGTGKALQDETYLAVLATASLLWPILFLETYLTLEADIYETASGNLVWRSRTSGNSGDDLSKGDVRMTVFELFEPLEHALPTVFIAQ